MATKRKHDKKHSSRIEEYEKMMERLRKDNKSTAGYSRPGSRNLRKQG